MPSGNVSNPAPTRCVLWHPRDERPDADLIGALTRKGFGIQAASDGFAALARLCVPLAGARHTPRSPAILLFQDPARLGPGAIAQTLAAAELYAPRATAWLFERPTGGSKAILRAVTPEDRAAWLAALPAKPSTVVAPATNQSPPPATNPAPAPSPRPSIITRSDTIARLGSALTPKPTTTFARATFSPARLRLAGEGPLPPPADQQAEPQPSAPAADQPAGPATATTAAPSTADSSRSLLAAAAGGSVPTSHLLTDEELAMLLAHDPSTSHTSLSESPAQGSGSRGDSVSRPRPGEPKRTPSVPDPHAPRA
ncbi:MAG: hypothetical protein SFY95_00035 [Planctomycetota bacterium]|nr:hypothetical protein [Planctomycetota bacterium]